MNSIGIYFLDEEYAADDIRNVRRERRLLRSQFEPLDLPDIAYVPTFIIILDNCNM